MTTEERLEKLERELTVAKRHNCRLTVGLALLLAVCVVVWVFDRNTPGRYVLSATPGGAYVLDTRTGELLRSPLPRAN